MSVVDTSTWKKFRVGDLFELLLAKGDIQPKQCEDGDTLLVSAGNEDNGVVARISETGDGVSELFPAGCITVSMFGRAFWQDEAFYAVSHGRVNILQPMHDVSNIVGLFLAAALNAATGDDFNYQTMCTRARLSNVVLALPSTPDGEPDWAYMDNYMRTVMDREEVFAEHLASLIVETEGHVVDTSKWKAFRVGDLFEIERGTRLTKADMSDGTIPFIGASSINNGITAFISNNEYLHDGHALTICYNGSVGETFLQTEPFWASDDVNVLRPKFSVSDEALMFVVPCLRSLRINYGYENKWTSAKLFGDKILLPATPDGSPDWDYMEAYMCQVMKREETYAIELERLL